MARGRCVCSGPSLLVCPATWGERAALLACGFLLCASAGRCLFSCPSTCPRQAWAFDYLTPPLARVAVRPVRVERLAVVGLSWAAPTVAAVVASPVPGAR